MTDKLCRHCGETKLFSEFHKQAKAHDGVQSRCKPCDKVFHAKRYLKDRDKIKEQTKAYRDTNKDALQAKQNEWKQRNPEKVRAYQRRANLRKNFGIEVEDYQQMLDAQAGVCFICKEPETYIHQKTGQVARLAVDHCHTKGTVRKLLCKSCNNGLGLFRDSPQLLREAAGYLEDHERTLI